MLTDFESALVYLEGFTCSSETFFLWYFLSLKELEERHFFNQITEQNERVRKIKHSKSIFKLCNSISFLLRCALLCYLKSS